MEKSMKQKNSVKTYKLKTKEYHIPSSGVVVISAVITSKTSITLMIAWPAEGFNAILSDFPLIDIVAFKTSSVPLSSHANQIYILKHDISIYQHIKNND
jgi:hypothetical protein